jgi:large subunit ribosomal protein L4
MPGGGKVFGPVPRSYDYSLPKKVRALALKMALRAALDERKLFIYDQIESDGKTNALAKKLSSLGFQKALLLDGQKESLLGRSARNLKNFKYTDGSGLNVEDMLRYKTVVLTQEALKSLEARLGGTR